MKLALLSLVVGLGILSSGCAVSMRAATPRVVVYEDPYYVQPQPVYVQPAPVYVQPAPVYRQPHRHHPHGGRHCHGPYPYCR